MSYMIYPIIFNHSIWKMWDSLYIFEMNILFLYNISIMGSTMMSIHKTSIEIEKNKFFMQKNHEWEVLEFLWTLIPGLILIYLGMPSLELLYNMEMKTLNELTIKIIGNQWYWSYEYTGMNDIYFDSFMIPYNEIKIGDFHLLETDNSMIIPFKMNILCLLTSNDVIHSWSIPSLNTKCDANPGRLNSFFLFSKIPSIFYGQCSEICGSNHSFMPIKLEVCNLSMFKMWISSF